MEVRMTDPHEGLRIYLAERDVRCPRCGYNLRGVQEPRCPECGLEIQIEIAGSRRGGLLWFVLLALGWVLVAGGMNTARSARDVWNEATPGPQVLTLGSGIGSIVINSPPSRQVRLSSGRQQMVTGSLRIQSSLSVTGSSVILSPAPSSTGAQWANVATMSWVSLGWWATLSVVALVLLGVVALVCWRGRGQLVESVAPAAAGLFALYGGYHIFLFVREMMG
jgi:hypothetical protein